MTVQRLIELLSMLPEEVEDLDVHVEQEDTLFPVNLICVSLAGNAGGHVPGVTLTFLRDLERTGRVSISIAMEPEQCKVTLFPAEGTS